MTMSKVVSDFKTDWCPLCDYARDQGPDGADWARLGRAIAIRTLQCLERFEPVTKQHAQWVIDQIGLEMRRAVS